MAFKDSLRYVRKQHGLTQEELAYWIGVSKSTISMYEQGEREPNYETLIRLAQFLDVSVDSLLNNGNANINIEAGLKYYREHKSLSREDLSALTGLSSGVLEMYESGRCIPDYQTLCLLSVCLEIQPYQLFSPRLPPSHRENQVLDAYRNANPDDKQIIDIIVDKYSAQEEIKKLKREKDAMPPIHLRAKQPASDSIAKNSSAADPSLLAADNGKADS